MRRRGLSTAFRALALAGLFVAGATLGGVAAGGNFFPPSLTKAHSPAIGTVGQPLTYSLTVRNPAFTTETIETVMVTDTLPEDVAFVSAPGCVEGEGVVVCDADTLSPQEAAAFAIVVTPTVAGTITNSAVATGDSCGDGCEVSSNTVVDVATVVGGAPPPPPPSPPPPPPPPEPADVTIAIRQEVLPAAFAARKQSVVPAGTRMRYLLTVTNNGPGVARDVFADLRAPAGSSFQSASTDVGSCSGATTVTCSFGNLTAGQQAHVTAVATVAQDGTATATASVRASGPDPSPSNNTVSASIDVSAAPVPVFGSTAVPQIASGFVCVQLPSSSECVDIRTLTEIPVGSIIDTRVGRLRLTVATSTGTLETSELYEGLFQLLQTTLAARSAAARGQAASVTEFRLAGGDFSDCMTAQPAKVKKPKAKKKKRKPAAVDQARPRKPVRRLWGDGSGSFRTRGRYSAATVRGTVWLTEDYCNGTLVRVREGSVTVRDLVKDRTVVVTAGGSYFAEAPPPRRRRG